MIEKLPTNMNPKSTEFYLLPIAKINELIEAVNKLEEDKKVVTQNNPYREELNR